MEKTVELKSSEEETANGTHCCRLGVFDKSRRGLSILPLSIFIVLCFLVTVSTSYAQNESIDELEATRKKLEAEYQSYREMDAPPPGFRPTQVSRCIEKLCEVDRRLIQAIGKSQEADGKKLLYLGMQLLGQEEDLRSFNLQFQMETQQDRLDSLKVFLEEVFGAESFLVTDVRLSIEDQKLFEGLSNLQNQKLAKIERDAKIAFDQAKNGRADDAVKTSERVAAVAREIFGPNNRNTAETLTILADTLQNTTRIEAAGPLLQEVVTINQIALGVDHPTTAESHGLLGEYLIMMGNREGARKSLEEAIRIHEVALKKNHPAYRVFLLSKADRLLNPLYGPMDPGIAEKFVQESRVLVEFWREYRGSKDTIEQDRDLRQVDDYSARIAFSRKDYDVAIKKWEDVLRRQLGMQEKSPPMQAGAKEANDRGQSNIRLGLATAYACRGDYVQAKEQYDRNRELIEKSFGREHLGYAEAIGEMALGEMKLEHVDDALMHFDEAMRAMRIQASDLLPYLPEPQQLQFLEAQYSFILHGSLTAAGQRRSSLHARELSAGWLLNSKGITNETLSDRYRLTRQTVSEDSKALLTRWRQVRQQLAKESQQGTNVQDHRSQLESLEHELWAELAPQLGSYSKPKWVDLTDVRKQLQKGEVLIEFARFQSYDFANFHGQNEWKSSRYAAWIIPPSGDAEVQLVELGESEIVDTAILEWRQQIALGGGNGQQNANQEEPRLRLRRLLLEPLEPFLKDATQLLIAPDGELWLLPWCALPLHDERFLIEKYALTLLVSGRDLARKGEATPSNPSLVFANPDYDLDLSIAPTNALASKPSNPNWISKSRTGVATSWGPLPGTEKEAKELKPLLQKVTGKGVDALFGPDARESRFDASSSPEILVFCTHGFFLPNQKNPSKGNNAALESYENPLLRCGLVLAGANKKPSANNSALVEDGLLTGLEVASSDLRGTKLVVLSACETAVGEVRTGEGVAGMRQAFQLAGAESVMGTLWQIPDAASALLMQKFWNGVAAGKSKSESLRLAQVEMIHDFDAMRDNVRGIVREANQRSVSNQKSSRLAPYFWAAYALTGETEILP